MRRSSWLVIIAVVALAAGVLIASGGRRHRGRAPATSALPAPPAVAVLPALPAPAMRADDEPAGFVGIVVTGGDRPAAVRFAVPERERGTLAVGGVVGVRTPDGELTARIERIAADVEPASRTFVVDARIADARRAAAARGGLGDGAMVRVASPVAP